MNPGDNNPLNNAGATGTTPGSAPLDFTTPAGNSSVNSGLSMADSMAVAQDNLTSAGMAAPDAGKDALGLDQISSIDPTASMAASDQPLVPAAPVPGSIGSVTSVPPLETPAEPADLGLGGAGAGSAGAGAVPAGVVPTGTTPVGAAPTNPFVDMPAATIADGAGGVGSALPTSNPMMDAPKANEPVQPYNPFAAQPGAMATSSSSNIPDALQPPVEKFTGDAGSGKPKSSVLTIILGGLALIFAVTTAIFVVLWMQAKETATGGPIVIPPLDNEPVQDTLALMTCSRDDGVGEGIEGFADLQSMNHLVTVNFKNDDLASIELANGFGFATPEAAEAMRPYFESDVALIESLGGQLGIEPVTAEFTIDGYTVSERLVGTPDKLIGDYLPRFMLTADATGNIDKSLEAVKANYEASGFACQVE